MHIDSYLAFVTKRERKGPLTTTTLPCSTKNFLLTQATSHGLPWRAHVVPAKLMPNLPCVSACGLSTVSGSSLDTESIWAFWELGWGPRPLMCLYFQIHR